MSLSDLIRIAELARTPDSELPPEYVAARNKRLAAMYEKQAKMDAEMEERIRKSIPSEELLNKSWSSL